MKARISIYLLVGLSVLLFSACGRGSGEAPKAKAPRIVLLTDEAGLAGAKRLPPGTEVLALSPTGKEGLSEQLGRIIAEGAPAALIVCPLPDSSARAFVRAREASPGILLYAGMTLAPPPGRDADNGLLLESAADLIVELASVADLPDLEGGLAELARRAIPGKVKSDNLEEFLAALRAAAPGRGWTGTYSKDPDSGIKSRNHLVISPSNK